MMETLFMYSRLSLNSYEKILRNALLERKEQQKQQTVSQREKDALSLFLSYILGFLHRQVVSPKTPKLCHSTQSHPSPQQQRLSLPGKRGTARADGKRGSSTGLPASCGLGMIKRETERERGHLPLTPRSNFLFDTQTVMTGVSVTSWKLQKEISKASSKRILKSDPFCAKPLAHNMDNLEIMGQSQLCFLGKF